MEQEQQAEMASEMLDLEHQMGTFNLLEHRETDPLTNEEQAALNVLFVGDVIRGDRFLRETWMNDAVQRAYLSGWTVSQVLNQRGYDWFTCDLHVGGSFSVCGSGRSSADAVAEAEYRLTEKVDFIRATWARLLTMDDVCTTQEEAVRRQFEFSRDESTPTLAILFAGILVGYVTAPSNDSLAVLAARKCVEVIRGVAP